MTSEGAQQLERQIEAGVRAGVRKALEEHRRAGRKVAIWKDGQVVLVDPPAAEETDSLALREEPPKQPQDS